MSRDREKDIDNIFRKGLEPPGSNANHLEDDWAAMEQMLNERKKRPVIFYWVPILGSVAAVILIVIGWWLLKPAVKVNQFASHVIHKDIVGPKVITRQSLSTIAKNGYLKDTIEPRNTNTVNKGKHINDPLINSTYLTHNNSTKANNIDSAQIEKVLNKKSNMDLVVYTPSLNIQPSSINEIDINDVDLTSKPSDYTKGLSKIKAHSTSGYIKQFALTVLASSDKNGVNSFQQSKSGNNAGIVFSLGLSKRFTISTGVIYSAKQYMTDFANYHSSGSYQFPSNPVSVLADCKMFDIPLNIDYRVFGNFRNKISVGTGISSYLMLHENYQYTYAVNNNIGGPAQYNVPNPDKYLLSIANIQLTYERRINSSVGLTLQPYMKLPLSAVGASEVKLQSTGVAVGLTWNLNSASKP